MDLVAEKLAEYLKSDNVLRDGVDLFQPRFKRFASALPTRFKNATRFNIDRLINRLIAYPKQTKKLHRKHDLFHVADHTYAALVHSLPHDRTGVYCHDLDAFRCLIEPANDPRPWWFRKMSSHSLVGMQKAAVVFHSTLPVREKILEHKLLPEEKLVHAPYGVSEEFQYHADVATIPSWLNAVLDGPWILHVGSCIPRKRIDVLLKVFTQVRLKTPELQLVKIGGEFTADQLDWIQTHDLQRSIVHVAGISRSEMAVAYRLANCVLVTSEAEGFGLPIIEALACGASVIASDIPVLREVGGEACLFAPVGDVGQWSEIVQAVLQSSGSAPSIDTRLNQASKYTWENHAKIIADAYKKLL